MAGPLASELERKRKQDELAIFVRNENAIAAQLGFVASPLTDADSALLASWVQFCSARKVRFCPCKPPVLATFILESAHRGEEVILATVRAVEALHNVHGFSNPAATAVVHSILNQIIKTEPPRSWPKEDKLIFAQLPPEIKSIIAKREHDRETSLRRAQNEAAAKRKQATPEKVAETQTT